ncbi:ABC transporter ATP-binding protein [Bacillus cereus]|nr:ABC transporter ATP-binding protein [Bacillus thuringiensis]PFU57500.1 ABC transporter ATP-binding protein [Bacillus cereus]
MENEFSPNIPIYIQIIEEIESIFDEVIFLKDGNIVLHENVEEIRFHQGKAVYELIREVFEK